MLRELKSSADGHEEYVMACASVEVFISCILPKDAHLSSSSSSMSSGAALLSLSGSS